jgi:hypothetical protein
MRAAYQTEKDDTAKAQIKEHLDRLESLLPK